MNERELIPYTAHEVAGSPDLYNRVIYLSLFDTQGWDCAGYSRTGNTVLFFDIREGGPLSFNGLPFRILKRYLRPETIVYVEV